MHPDPAPRLRVVLHAKFDAPWPARGKDDMTRVTDRLAHAVSELIWRAAVWQAARESTALRDDREPLPAPSATAPDHRSSSATRTPPQEAP